MSSLLYFLAEVTHFSQCCLSQPQQSVSVFAQGKVLLIEVTVRPLAHRNDKPHHRQQLIITHCRWECIGFTFTKLCPCPHHYCTFDSTSDSIYEKSFLQLRHDDHSNLQVEPLICGFRNPQCTVLSHLMLFTSSEPHWSAMVPSRGQFRNLHSLPVTSLSCILSTNADEWIKSNHIFSVDFLLFFPLGKMSEGLFSALMRLGGQDHQSSELTLPPHVDPALKALQLTEALRAVLEGQGSEEEQDSLRKQVSTDTAHVILKWLERDEVSEVSLWRPSTLRTGMDDKPQHYVTPSMQIQYPIWNIQNPIYEKGFW